jgi:hypothetical protein
MGSYTILDGSTYIGSGWSLGGGGPANISDGSSDNTDVTLGSASEYAAHLVQVLREPPITESDLPPDLQLQPINQIEKGLQNRNQVVAINPMGLEEAETVPLVYSVETTSGVYQQEVDVVTSLPWGVSTGVRTVPVNSSVLLYGKEGASYSWSIVGAPGSSTATLTDANTRTPWFTPDAVGTYEIQNSSSGATVEVHAGRYHGVIDPVLTLDSVMFGDGRPVADESCTACHYEGGAAPANFDTWRNTGHAEAFTQGITTNGHFSEHCFACHAVGFGKESGIDDTPNYDAFITALSDEQHGGDISTLWETMLTDMPDTARLSNIQCENCHGPQSYTEAHMDQPGAPRVSLSADVCGSCHGEPARHGRFQQWQLSNHADYDLARERGAGGFAPGNCGRCHSGNGFVAWSKLDNPFDPDTNVTVTWDEDTVVPQTCAACHNPHDTGTTSGSDETNARVRVNGEGGTCGGPLCDTYKLVAGFTAVNVGKGATCMTCHNSRAGDVRTDANWNNLSDSEKTGGPHHGVQADLIMGQNMYFFASNELVRGKHSLIEDTCVTCHMNKTQPPDLLSYNQAGTNHTFAADPNICSECHGDTDPNANNIDALITTYMGQLETALDSGYMRLLANHYPVAAGGGCNVADGGNPITAVTWNYGGHSGSTLDITLDDGSSCSNRSLGSVQVDGGANSLVDVLLNPANGAEDLLKARWNYGMNYEDETINGCTDNTDPNCNPPHTHRGVHNADFQIKSLTRAIDAVNAVLN